MLITGDQRKKNFISFYRKNNRNYKIICKSNALDTLGDRFYLDLADVQVFLTGPMIFALF